VTGPDQLAVAERDQAIIEGVIVSQDAFEPTRANAIFLKDVIERTKHIRWSIENAGLNEMVQSEMIAEFMKVPLVPELVTELAGVQLGQ